MWDTEDTLVNCSICQLSAYEALRGNWEFHRLYKRWISTWRLFLINLWTTVEKFDLITTVSLSSHRRCHNAWVTFTEWKKENWLDDCRLFDWLENKENTSKMVNICHEIDRTSRFSRNYVFTNFGLIKKMWVKCINFQRRAWKVLSVHYVSFFVRCSLLIPKGKLYHCSIICKICFCYREMTK